MQIDENRCQKQTSAVSKHPGTWDTWLTRFGPRACRRPDFVFRPLSLFGIDLAQRPFARDASTDSAIGFARPHGRSWVLARVARESLPGFFRSVQRPPALRSG